MSKDRKIILGLIVLGSLLFSFWAFNYGGIFSEKIEAYEFRVIEIKDIQGSTIIAEGYSLIDGVDDIGDRMPMEVEILINSNTEFERTKLIRPSVQELEDSGGFYNLYELPKEIEVVSIDSFIDDASSMGFPIMFVKSDKNIYNKLSFNASAIKYSYLTKPEYPGNN
ncbi:MAG: hypothetical protein IH859_08005 [Chloroflexi bacterium]|nr:hypothetical protein [Chloroflexota bacterium]